MPKKAIKPDQRLTRAELFEVFEEHKDIYTKFFDEEAEARALRLELAEDEDNEEIWFEGVTLELNDEPSFYAITDSLMPIVGPRLELHLRGSIGMHSARRQMGRIARYIDARRLQEEYPFISATTYTPLAKVAHRITKMPPALIMYIPPRDDEDDDADRRFSGAFDSYNEFLRRHGRSEISEAEAEFDCLILSTRSFVKLWRDE